MKRFRIYDNGGETFDRYTLVIREKDSKELHFYGCGIDPRVMSHYCGSSSDGYAVHAKLGAKLKQVPESIAGFYAQCVRNCGHDFHASDAINSLT